MNGIKTLTRLTLGLAGSAALFAGIGYLIDDSYNTTVSGFLGGIAAVSAFLGLISFIGLILALVISSFKGGNGK